MVERSWLWLDFFTEKFATFKGCAKVFFITAGQFPAMEARSQIVEKSFGGEWRIDGECPPEVAVEFPVQGTKTLSSLRQRVLRMFQPDHVNGTLRAPSTLPRAVGLVDHRGSD